MSNKFTTVKTEDEAEYLSSLRATSGDVPVWSDFQQSKVDEAVEMLRVQLRCERAFGDPLTSPERVRVLLQLKLARLRNESFVGLFLDTRHRLLSDDVLFTGTIDSAHVHPRVVCEKALGAHAAAVIVAHNHPSGCPEPSAADLAITRRLRDALGLLDIRLLDHFIVGGVAASEIVSLAERGLV